jgi:hypothetical protein
MRGTLIAPSIVAALATVGLAGCTSQTKAPTDTGVCYSVTLPEEGEKGEPQFNVVARDQPQIEYCAAQLEQMRVRFLRLGGSRRDVIGAYQGQFIFIDRAGVYFGRSLEGTRFFALARTGDGRLAVPGAIERPAEPETPAAQ